MTNIELRRRVLEKLQVVAVGEGPHASDGQVVQAAYERLHEMLLADNLVSWVVTEDIPTTHESVMISMTAAELVDEFYCPPDLRNKILAEGKYDVVPPTPAERRLRKLAAPTHAHAVMQTDYF